MQGSSQEDLEKSSFKRFKRAQADVMAEPRYVPSSGGSRGHGLVAMRGKVGAKVRYIDRTSLMDIKVVL